MTNKIYTKATCKHCYVKSNQIYPHTVINNTVQPEDNLKERKKIYKKKVDLHIVEARQMVLPSSTKL